MRHRCLTGSLVDLVDPHNDVGIGLDQALGDESVTREQELLAVTRDMKKWVFIAIALGGLAALIALIASLIS